MDNHCEDIPMSTDQNNEEKAELRNEDYRKGQDTPLTVETEITEPRFYYDVHEHPPIHMSFFFAMQQTMMSFSSSLITSLLVAEVVCARSDEVFKARLLSTTMLFSGLCTFLQNTVGIRLPLYQGPASTYVIPLIALSALPRWNCDNKLSLLANVTLNESVTALEDSTDMIHMLEGSLMIAGAFHFLVGATGIVGMLVKFIGPITIVPTLTMVALYIHRVTVKFGQTQWAVCFFTVAVSVIMSFYLRGKDTPIPTWSRGRGFRIKYYPLHKMFSVMLACLLGWLLSAALTFGDVISNDPNSTAFYARTDSRLFVIEKTSWFIFPYPGQFGPPSYDTGALITFMMGTINSIIDSIGDYYACAKVCDVPPPPTHAVNRGIAVEGLMSFLSGWAGAGHATSTYGTNIGAIGVTKVASIRVFQLVGLIFIVFGVLGKIGAVFVTIPYSVVGGMLTVNLGVMAGVVLSNIQYIDMNSSRNQSIIGTAMLTAFMFPYWIETTDNPIDTGIETLDGVIVMFLANPAFIAGFVACFLDNTIPGTLKERGMLLWQQELIPGDNTEEEEFQTPKERERMEKVRRCVYSLPIMEKLSARIPFLRFIPFWPPAKK